MAQDTSADAGPPREEVAEVANALDALLTATGNYARTEDKARRYYAYILPFFGAESREAIQIERLIVLATLLQNNPDVAVDLGLQMMQRANRVLMADDTVGYAAAATFSLALSLSGKPDQGLSMATEALTKGELALPQGALVLQELRWMQVQAAARDGQRDVALAALELLETNLRTRTEPSAIALRAVAMTWWAGEVMEAGDPAGAVPLFGAALEALDSQFAGLKSPDMQPVRLFAVGRMAEAMILSGDRDGAVALLQPLLARIDAHYGADSTFHADIAFLLATALAGTEPGGKGEKDALLLMEQAVTIRAAVMDPNAEDLLRARINHAVLLSGAGRHAEALTQIAAMQGLSMPGDRQKQVYVLRMAEESGALTREAAIDAVLTYLQNSQLTGAAAAQHLLSTRLSAGAGPAAEALRARSDAETRVNALRSDLAQASARPRSDRDAGAEAALAAQFDAAADRLSMLGRQLETTYPDLAQLTGKTTLDLAQIRARLGPDAALVVIDMPERADDPGLIVAVSATSADWHTINAPADELAGAVSLLRDQIGLTLGVRGAAALAGDAAAPAPPAFDLWAAHWLFQQLLVPVSEVTQGKTQLYVDLRGPISALPLQLLVASPPLSDDPSQADWLVRHHAVTVLPAIAALPSGPADLPQAGQGMLAFADPTFADPETTAQSGQIGVLRGSLSPLPETADEVTEVASLLGLGPSGLRLGAAATETSVKSADMSQVGLLYFATHGLVSGDQVGPGQVLQESALALTPGGGEDGFLTTSEIAMLRLNAGLVVLSACNTAAGSLPGSKALSGLVQAFLYAGARGLLVSHWPVESRSAVALMTDLFARRAADPGLSAAAAQQQALLAMIDAPADPRWSHPAYWAPFIVVGQPD